MVHTRSMVHSISWALQLVHTAFLQNIDLVAEQIATSVACIADEKQVLSASGLNFHEGTWTVLSLQGVCLQSDRRGSCSSRCFAAASASQVLAMRQSLLAVLTLQHSIATHKASAQSLALSYRVGGNMEGAETASQGAAAPEETDFSALLSMGHARSVRRWVDLLAHPISVINEEPWETVVKLIVLVALRGVFSGGSVGQEG
jgi:hypothetical protein